MTVIAEPRIRRGVGTPRELLGRAGRTVLWLAVVLVLVRGLADVFAADRRPLGSRAQRSAASVWPDDAARAFAVQFATVYLERPGGEGAVEYAQRVAALAAPELADAIVPRLDPDGSRQTVRSAVVAGTVAVDRRHALVTVAASVAVDGALRVLRVTVPVARDAAGRLVVDDLPSLAPAPTLGTAAPAAGGPLIGRERGAIADLLTRFLRAYLAGDAGGLSYLVPAGTRIGAVAGGFALVRLGSIAAAGPVRRGWRTVLATVYARDRVSRAELALRYRVRLVRRERWYVAELNPAGRR